MATSTRALAKRRLSEDVHFAVVEFSFEEVCLDATLGQSLGAAGSGRTTADHRHAKWTIQRLAVFDRRNADDGVS